MTVPADNPLVASRVDTTSPVAGLWLLESIRDARASIGSDSWVDPAIGVGGAGLATLGMVVDPVGSLVSMGVAWLMEQVRPLSEALDWLAGDPDQIAAHAQTWVNVSTQAAACAEQLSVAVQRDVAGWAGQAAEVYRAHVSEQVAALAGVSEAAAGIGQATEGAGQLVAAVRAIVRDLVAECVAILAARVPQWLAMTGGTLGVATPWVIAQVANLVATWVARITRFINGLLTSLARLAPLLRHLSELLAQLRAILARLTRHDPTVSRMADPGVGRPRQRDGAPDADQASGVPISGVAGEPNFGSASIPDAKLRSYALNPEHPVGGHKAHVIQSRTGLGRDDADLVRQQIMDKVQHASRDQWVRGRADQHGQRWNVDISLEGPSGNLMVRTAWIVRPGGSTDFVTISFP